MLLPLALTLSPFLAVILIGLLILATDGPLQAETRYVPGFGPPGLKRQRLHSRSSRARAMMASIRRRTTSRGPRAARCSSNASGGPPVGAGEPSSNRTTAGRGRRLSGTSISTSGQRGLFGSAAAASLAPGVQASGVGG